MFMQFVKDTFRTLKVSYLIRQYFFGILIFGIYYFAIVQHLEGYNYMYITFIYGLNFLFYPFATLVWDEIKNLVIGNNVFFANALLLLIIKLIIKLFIFGFAIPIGIIGILYLWIVRKNTQNSQE